MAAGAGERSVRVMVVDDTDHVRKMLTAMLQLDGFEVAGQAASGPEALALVDDTDPDVMVIDYKMPHMDGLTLARQLRSRRPEQPIILYTAFLDDELRSAAAEAGVAVCLGKVEGLPSLELEIRRLCTSLF